MPENISGLPPVQLLSRAEKGVKAAEYALNNTPELREDQLAAQALLIVASVSRSTLLDEVRDKSPVAQRSLSRRERIHALSYIDTLIGEVTARAVLLGWDQEPQKEPQRTNPASEYSPQYDVRTEVLAQLDLLEAAKRGLNQQRITNHSSEVTNKKTTQIRKPSARGKKPQSGDAAWRERSKIRRAQEKGKGQRSNNSSALTSNQRRNKRQQNKKRDT